MKAPRVVAASVTCSIAVFAVLSGCTQSAESAADEFWEQLNKGNVAAAQEMLSAQNRLETHKEINAQRMLAYFSQDIAKRGGIETIKKQVVSKTNTHAKLSIDLRFENGTSEYAPLDLFKEDGKWRVHIDTR